MPVLRDPEPDMLAVVERFGYFLELQHFFVEIRSPVQIRDEDRLVAEMRSLGAGGNGQHEREAKNG